MNHKILKSKMFGVTKKGQLHRERERSVAATTGDTVSHWRPTFYRRYGRPVWQYFHLCAFTIFLNFLTALIGLADWALYFTCHYQCGSYFNNVWLICSIILFSLYIASGPLFYFSCFFHEKDNCSATFRRGGLTEEKGNVAPFDFPERIEEELFVRETSNDEQYFSVPMSVVLSVCFLLAAAGVLCGLVWAQRAVSSNGDSLPFGITPFFLMGLLVSIFFSVINIVWSFLSFLITSKEKWTSWQFFQRSHGAKIILVKILLSSIMYLWLSIIITPSTSSCAASEVGNAYLIVIGTELLVSLFVKTLFPTLIMCKNKVKTLEFDFSEEMLQIFYKQFIVQLCSFVSPWAGIAALVTSLLEFLIDSLRLKYVCKDPGITIGDFRMTLSLMFLFLAFCSFISYPNGFLWMVIIHETLPFSYRTC
jgi:hypothetical protein